MKRLIVVISHIGNIVPCCTVKTALRIRGGFSPASPPVQAQADTWAAFEKSVTERRTALITGANRGIGLEVARQLAKSGYMVWLGARDAEKGMAAASSIQNQGSQVKFQLLDVTNDESVAAAVKNIADVSGQLDILVNNAGIALDGGVAPSDVAIKMVRATFEINFFGCIRVTQAFLPLLHKSKAARIVMVSSDIGSLSHQTNPNFPYYGLNPMAYASSKTALNAVTIAFAKELRDSGIKVNAANPGFTATDLNDYRGVNSVELGAAPIVELATLPDDGPTGTFRGTGGVEPW